MKSLAFALSTLLTILVGLLWLCGRFAQIQPVSITAPAPVSSVGDGPYTAYAKPPPIGKHSLHYVVTATAAAIPSYMDGRWDAVPPSLRHRHFWPLPGYQRVYPLAFNRRNQIVGYCNFVESGAWLVIRDGAFLWQRGRMHGLETLPDYQMTYAVAINNQGIIVGDTVIDNFPADSESPSHAICWIGGKVRDLGTGASSTVNEDGDIVGDSGTQAGDHFQVPHALLWTHGYRYDLNDYISPTSGWILEYATQIDNRGRIRGNGIFYNKPHAFLLTPQ